jgi:predicted nucleic acid-binding protein
MSSPLLLNTDVLIDYLRGQPDAVTYLENLTDPLFVSAVTVAELYAGVREGVERAALETFLATFVVIPVDDAIARQGGLYRRDFGKSHGTGLADALIAATAELRHATLVPLNKKHFPMVATVLVPYHKP